MKDVSIVILNWNGCALLRECLPAVEAAVSAYSGGDCEVIVADNASTDASRRFVADAFPRFRCLAFSANLGFARAMNAAIRECRHPLVICLNNDVVVEPGFIAPLAAGFSGATFCCGAKMLCAGKGRLYFGRAAGSFATGFFVRRVLDSASPSASLYGCAGACMLDREKFLSLGGFDERMDVYWEDLDLCWRAWKRGWETRYVPASVCYHKVAATNRDRLGKYGIDRLSGRNYIFFLIKNIRDPWFLLTQSLTLPALLAAALAAGKPGFCLGVLIGLAGSGGQLSKRAAWKSPAAVSDRQVLRMSAVSR